MSRSEIGHYRHVGLDAKTGRRSDLFYSACLATTRLTLGRHAQPRLPRHDPRQPIEAIGFALCLSTRYRAPYGTAGSDVLVAEGRRPSLIPPPSG